MPKKTVPRSRTPNLGSNISMYPLSPDDATRAILSISKEDAKRIAQGKPKKKR